VSYVNIALWGAFVVCVLGFLGFTWQFANAKGARARGRRRTQARESDKRSLSRNEKKLYAQSQKLMTEGNVASAARILEQIQMHREAIQALEDAGMIHDAAKVLMRMHRANRAGVVYARHGMWNDAAKCFKLAKMPLEVGKCAREAGDWTTAAESFEEAGRLETAANCYARSGNLQKAAELFSQIGNKEKAMKAYSQLSAKTDNINTLEISNRDIEMIVEYIADGNADKALSDLIINRNRLTEVILVLVSNGHLDQAGDLLMRSANDIGPQLMAEVNYQDDSAKHLSEVFLKVSNFNYAGMVLERMTSFKEAGAAFEKAEDYDRAAHCYERSGDDKKADQLREIGKKAAKRPTKTPATPFSLAASGQAAFSESDSTSVLPQRDVPPPPAPEFAKEEVQEATSPPPPPSPMAGRPQPPKKIPFKPQPLDTETDSGTKEAEARGTGNFSLGATPPPPRPINPVDEATKPSAAPAPEEQTQEADRDEETNGIMEMDAQALPPVKNELESEPVSLDDGRPAFHKAQFFGDLDFQQKNSLWNIGRTFTFSEGEVLLTYNDEPKGIYVIVEGSVGVYREKDGKDVFVDDMDASETFGELWLLADQPTAVKFVASKKTRLRIIERHAFNDVLDRDGALARKIYRRFTMRLVKRLLKSTPAPRTTSKAS
jgi:tetratricopeptide (TPR) repeat protein